MAAAILLILLLWLALALAFNKILVLPRGNRFDFYAAWAALQAAKTGEDPYSTDVSQRIQRDQQLYSTHLDHGGFVHPPHVLVLFYPASYLRFPVFVSLWVGLLFIACFVSVPIGLYLLDTIPPKPVVAVLAFACLMFRYSMMSITFAQPTCLCLLALLLALWLFRESQDWGVGVALAVALVKPDLTIGIAVVLVGVALLKRRFELLRNMVATALALGVAATLLLGWSWPTNYLRAVLAYLEYHKSTWVIAVVPYPLLVVFLPLVLLSLWRIYKCFVKSRWAFLAAHAVVLSFVLVPQSGTYNLTLLLIPIIIGWVYSRGLVRWGWLLLCWCAPWLVWHMASDPGLDLVVMPWVVLLGMLVLESTWSGNRNGETGYL
jgi:hypothetical protein